jgi:hypothetical protein
MYSNEEKIAPVITPVITPTKNPSKIDIPKPDEKGKPKA